MKESNINIDTSKLRKKANTDELKEAYETLHRSDNYRIGAGVRTNKLEEKMIFFLEVVIPLCKEAGDLKLDDLKAKVDLLEKFEISGYSLRCEKDNTIICERKIAENKVKEEYKRLGDILKSSTMT